MQCSNNERLLLTLDHTFQDIMVFTCVTSIITIYVRKFIQMLHNLVHTTDSLLCDSCGREAPCMNAQHLLFSMSLKGVDVGTYVHVTGHLHQLAQI